MSKTKRCESCGSTQITCVGQTRCPACIDVVLAGEDGAPHFDRGFAAGLARAAEIADLRASQHFRDDHPIRMSESRELAAALRAESAGRER